MRKRKPTSRIRKVLCAALLSCALLVCSTSLAQPRISTQLDADADRTTQTYTARHRLLGVSSVDHSAMLAVNGDYSGWLEQPDTVIDYPIAQTTDNKLYLDHSFQLEESKAGCLFLDCRNGAGYRDANNMVYGHHMKDDSMLATLVEYKDQDYYDEHPAMRLYTPFGDYNVEVFSGVIVSGEKDFLEFNFDSDEAFYEYWQLFDEENTFDCDVEIQRGDRIISLVTCTYEFDNARYILCGRLVPIEVWE